MNSNKSNGLIHFISFKILKKYPKWTFYYTIRKFLYFNYVGLLQMNLRKLFSFHGPFAFFFLNFPRTLVWPVIGAVFDLFDTILVVRGLSEISSSSSSESKSCFSFEHEWDKFFGIVKHVTSKFKVRTRYIQTTQV